MQKVENKSTFDALDFYLLYIIALLFAVIYAEY